MPLRIIGYDGAGYRAQLLGGGSRYPVISLVLYFGERPWGRVRTLRDALRMPDTRLEPFFNDYHLNLFEIAYLTDEQIAMFKSDFRLVGGRIMTYAEFGTPTDEIAARVGLPREEVERIMREVGILPMP